MEQQCSFRYAVAADIDIVYRWANDAEVRAQSFGTEAIPYANHQEWFHGILSSETAQLWIFCVDDIPAGQLRCHVNDEGEAFLSYSLDASFRGRGYGQQLIALASAAVRERFPDAVRLVALVKPRNEYSNRIFQANGYSVDYIRYSIPIRKDAESE